jgi:hypothetical protein
VPARRRLDDRRPEAVLPSIDGICLWQMGCTVTDASALAFLMTSTSIPMPLLLFSLLCCGDVVVFCGDVVREGIERPSGYC